MVNAFSSRRAFAFSCGFLNCIKGARSATFGNWRFMIKPFLATSVQDRDPGSCWTTHVAHTD